MNEYKPVASSLEAHYAPLGNLEEIIRSALAALGKDTDHLNPEDTAPLDEFHIRGREATLELAGQLGLGPQQRILDVGSGLGGPSRCLAHEFGCHVTGLDLTEPYCRVARMIADRMGMASRLTYLHGNALDMPFPDSSFDVVWTQHTAMNIPDKDRLYREIRRVLRPGGLFALYDVLAGAQAPPHFPLPWARDPALSFLITPAGLRKALEEAGFRIDSWRDTSELGRNWFHNLAAKRSPQREGAPTLGLHMILGPDIRLMSKNIVRNLEENRIVLIEVVSR